MTEAQVKKTPFPILMKREINWAQYLDYTIYIESEYVENDKLDKFLNDFLQ